MRKDVAELSPAGRESGISSRDEPLRTSALRAVQASRLVVPILAGALAAALAWFQLGTESLWLDEATSVFVARLPAPDLWSYAQNQEPHIGLYYALLHVWLNVGQSEWVARSLSAVTAVATVPVLYLLAERLFSRRIAVLAAVLFSLNAFVVAYAQEARPYALALLLTTACSYAFILAVEDRSAKRWGAYAAIAVLAVYAHIFAAFVLLAHLCSLLFRGRGGFPLRRVASVYGAVGLCSLPLLVLAFRGGTGRLAWIERPTLLDVPSLFSDLAGNGGPPLLLAYFVVCCLAVWSAARGWDTDGIRFAPWRFGFVITWLLVPPAMALAVSVVQPVFQSRYLIVSLPALMLLAAVGVAAVRRSWLRGAIVVVLVMLAGRSLLQYYASSKEGWREATASVLARARGGDAIVFYAPYVVQPFGYYVLRGGDVDRAPDAVYPAVRWTESLEPARGADSIRRVLHGGERYSRVWLVLSHDANPHELQERGVVLQALARDYREVSEASFTGIRIILFGAR